MADLITLAQAGNYLNLDSAQYSSDVMLPTMISAASQFFLNLTSLPYILTTSFTERRNGTGGSSMTVKNRPLRSITSLVINNLSVPSSPDGIQPGYYFNPGETVIYLTGGYDWQSRYFAAIGFGGYPGRFLKGYGNVFITGTAGYDTVPLDVQQCVYEMVGWAYKERDRIGKTTVRFADNLSESYARTPFSGRAKKTINNYARKDYIV